jgi:hypothetical protein
MGINKNFVVKNGIEVADNLIFADGNVERVGIGTTNPNVTLDVRGSSEITGSLTVGAPTVLNDILTVNGYTQVYNDLYVDESVTALDYYGDGVNLVGIVTQIVPSIGINIQETQVPGKGVVTIDAYKPVGKTIYVGQNGDDNNTGLTENHPKRTIKSAAASALYGDTIKVYPGVYIEENPIVLGRTVSVQGTELRNCVVTPKYPNLDMFYVNNGCHITNISFIGQEATNGAAIISLQPLTGVSEDRFFDAARMIRMNLDYIASETVGYLTSTNYKSPAFVIPTGEPNDCKDDIKDIWKCIIHDITRGGNSKCVGAGNSYYSGGTLLHITGTDTNGYSIKDATIDAIDYSFNIARAVVNNCSWGGYPLGSPVGVSSAIYSNTTGITTIVANGHGLQENDPVEVIGLGFTCPSGPSILNYPTGSYGYIFPVRNVIDLDTFEVVVGQSTLPHTYVSGGTVQKYSNFQNNFTQVKDLGMQEDPDTGFNNAINGCANVVSALRSCVGIVTTVVGLGSTAGITTSYPGNSGIGFTTLIPVIDAVYDETVGKATIDAPGLSINEGDIIEIRDLLFECSSGLTTSTQLFPSGRYGYEFYVDKINLDGTFDLNVGVSTLPHTYVSGGYVINRSIGVTTAHYDYATGITTITAPGAYVKVGDIVTLRDLEFSCTLGGPTLTFPSGKGGYDFQVTNVIGTGTTFVVNVGISTLAHYYVSGGIVRPPFSKGVGPIVQGPYIRNCTNFIGNSIGMKVDGFNAEPGDKDDIGVTGTMSVDSYTQYNQGGIGVSITNGGYAQLVSIFTICDDIAIYTGTGGQCDLTNSNASFGNYGLYSDGVGDADSKSIYRYTGIVDQTVSVNQDKPDTLVISGLGTYRPYDGQALYFGELFNRVDRINVTNGGSGYNPLVPPNVTIDSPPEDAFGIRAEGSVNIDSNTGAITSIDLISQGSQYRTTPNIIIDPPPGPGTTATATAEMYPIYYYIESATLPSAGISTVVLTQFLNNTVSAGTTAYLSRLSLQIATTISFEWVGAGTNINTAKPALGGIALPDNEITKKNGGQVVFTSTNQAGNFRIGSDLTINQLTGTISGRAFSQSLLNTVTPLVIAIGK